MEITFERQGFELVAKIDCSSGKRRLEGGGVGWYEVGFAEWPFDWKLRVQVSVTEPKPGHTYNDPQTVSVDLDPKVLAELKRLIPESFLMTNRPNAQHFAGPVFTTFVVERDIVEVIFPVPNCIHPFHGGGWGCAEGRRIELSSGRHHCQARVETRPPDYRSAIRRSNGGIEFVETELGQVRVIVRLEDC